VKVAAPSLSDYIVPITAAIIVCLFLLQRFGTRVVGRLFGPVMVIWFTAIAACGVKGIAYEPAILKAFSPSYALEFLFGHFSIAFFSLAAVVLAVTGAEALYADMGHFGRSPITRAWLLLASPPASSATWARAPSSSTTRPPSRALSSCSSPTGRRSRWCSSPEPPP
jgi:KUP system potassium uptake protein